MNTRTHEHSNRQAAATVLVARRVQSPRSTVHGPLNQSMKPLERINACMPGPAPGPSFLPCPPPSLSMVILRRTSSPAHFFGTHYGGLHHDADLPMQLIYSLVPCP